MVIQHDLINAIGVLCRTKIILLYKRLNKISQYFNPYLVKKLYSD